MFKSKCGKHLITIAFIGLLVYLSISTTLAIDVNQTDNVEVSDVENIQLNSQKAQGSYTKGTFQDIRNAINNAKDGDTINLDKNEYVGDGKSIDLNKSVNIVGKEGVKPIINGNNLSRIFFIYQDAANFKIENCIFVNGYCSNGGGGAMFIRGHDIEIRNCDFKHNEALSGGAIYTYYERMHYKQAGDNLKIIGCRFYNNLAYNAAGAVGCYGNNSQIMNCIFDSNMAFNKINGNFDSYGGALQLGKDEEYIRSKCVGSLFKNNSALPNGETHSHGGAGCVRDGVDYINCTFISNSASQGGALSYHSSGNINGCVFINNTAIDLFGGALSTGFLPTNMNLLIKDSEFAGNAAPCGGGCYLNGKSIIFDNCRIENNSASVHGGGIYIQASSTTIENSIIRENIANANGGGIFINADSTVLKNNQLYGNEAIPKFEKIDEGLGGAIYINSSKAILTNNTFKYNKARNGSGIYLDKYSTNTTLSNNRMVENQAWVYLLLVNLTGESVFYGEDMEIKSIIHGGNNIGRYLDFANSNAIYNAGNAEDLLVDGVNPVFGATESGKLYQDDREYSNLIGIAVYNNKGETVYNQTLTSNVYGEVSAILKNLDIGNYSVYVNHHEDNYYKGISNFASFSVIPHADVQVSKTKNESEYNYKDLVLWNLTIKNNGPNTATEVVIRDILPQGLIWIYDNSEGRYDPNTGILNLSGMSSGESLNILILTQINKTGVIVNHANISSKEHDFDLENNNDSAVIFVNPAADLEIAKTVDNSNPDYGDLVVWSLVVKNNGPDAATDVVVYDLLPDGLEYVSDDGNGQYNPSAGIWKVGKLAIGESRTLRITTVVNRTGSITNIAKANGNEYDWNESNNNVSVTISVNASADLEVNKSVDNLNPDYGDLVVWSITVKNNGPDVATDVMVHDSLPRGMEYIRDDGNGQYNPDTGIWTVGKLAIGESRTLRITTLVNKTGSFTNWVNVTGNEHDGNESNNNASVTVHVDSSADLEIAKSVDNSNPGYGDLVVWSVIVKNNGPDAASNVVVYDILSDGLEYVCDDSNGQYNPNTGIWTVRNLAIGESRTLRITTLVNKTGSFTNWVNVTGKEHDGNESNNNASVTIYVNASSDLAIEVAFSNSAPNYKDTVVLTLNATNYGPDGDSEVKAFITLPEGLILLGKNPEFSDGIWDIGDLAVLETRTLNLTFAVNKTGKLLAYSKIAGHNFDIDLSNNDASAGINVAPAADLEISKTASKYDYSIGDLIEYVIRVRNNGPDTAFNVNVIDKMFPETNLVSYLADVGAISKEGSLNWIIDELESNRSATLRYKVLASNAGSFLNQVEVISDSYDFDPSNNVASAIVEVEERFDELNNKTQEKTVIEDKGIANAEYCGLMETGEPIALLILALCSLIPCSFRYFNRK